MPPRIPPACSSSRWWRPGPFTLTAASRGNGDRGGQGRVHCGANPPRAGLWYAQHGLTVWFAFAGDHSGDLIAAVGWRGYRHANLQARPTPHRAGRHRRRQEAPRPRGCG